MIKSLIEQIQRSEKEAERLLRKARKNADEISANSQAKISQETDAIISRANEQAKELIADAIDKAQNDIDALVSPSQPHDVDARVAKAVDYFLSVVIKKYES